MWKIEANTTNSSFLDAEIKNKHNQLVIHADTYMEKSKNLNRDHGHACLLCAPVCLKRSIMPARQSGSPRQQCTGAISVFVDSIDSHIILRMVRESKRTKVRPALLLDETEGTNLND